MAELREKMREDLDLRGCSRATIDTYLRCVRRLFEHVGRPPAKVGAAEIRAYLLYLIREQKAQPATVNVYASAISFFYEVTLGRPGEVAALTRMKVPMRLPKALSGTDVEKLIEAFSTKKHLAMAMLAYGAGLRVSEITRLEFQDIDAKRMVLHIRNTKGGRQRYVMLSPLLLRTLRTYWKASRPPGSHLFPGRTGKGVITRAAIHKAFKKAAQRAGLSDKISPHSLRHSFATHLLESGTDIRTLQVLLGHASIRSTTAYLLITTARVQSLRSSLDDLGTPQGRRHG